MTLNLDNMAKNRAKSYKIEKKKKAFAINPNN